MRILKHSDNRNTNLNKIGYCYDTEIKRILGKTKLSLLEEDKSLIKYNRDEHITQKQERELVKISNDLYILIKENALSTKKTVKISKQEIKVIDGIIPREMWIKEEKKDTLYIVLSKGSQCYKLSGRSYVPLTTFPNKKIYKGKKTLCGENTETWLALDLKRATDYIDPKLDWESSRLLGMVTKVPLHLVICYGRLKYVCEEMEAKLIKKLTPTNQDILGNDSERLFVASLIFRFTPKTTIPQKAKAIVNLYRYLFGIPVEGGRDLISKTCRNSLLNNDINMNVDNQHKMLMFLNNSIKKILANEDEAISLYNTNKVVEWKAKEFIKQNLNIELTGSLTALQYTKIYLERAKEIKPTDKIKTNQRISYLAFDRIVAYVLCLITPNDNTHTPSSPVKNKLPETPTEQINRRYHGWYFPNVESFWADGGTMDFDLVTKKREKELEEFMIFNEMALTEKKLPKIAKLYTVVEHMIKTKDYVTCNYCLDEWSKKSPKPKSYPLIHN